MNHARISSVRGRRGSRSGFYDLAAILLGLIWLVACTNEKVAPSEQQVRDLAWRALEPNTSSHNRANWEFIEVKPVPGDEIAKQFEGEPAAGCWQGPAVAPNGKIDSSGAYWYVHLEPRPATPLPPKRTMSPTEPADVPEPFLYQADFLVDANTGRIVARKLYCSIP